MQAVLFGMVLVVLLGGVALVSSLFAHPTATVRVVAVLATGALAGFAVFAAWLIFLWTKWVAGYSCPDRGFGPGRVDVGGWAGPTTCRYAAGGHVSAVNKDAGWFFSLPWLIGTIAFTLAALALAFWVIRMMTRISDAKVRLYW